MPRVELIYDLDCPVVQATREALLRGFAEAGLRPAWKELDRRAAKSPPHATRYGSPTILVEGRDVVGAEPVDGADACRVYDHGPGGLRGVPPIPRIAAALRSATASPTARWRTGRGWWRPLAALPGAGAALLPVGLCPACWPAYAGVLGSLGLGFLLESTYQLPVTAGLLGLAQLALGFRARTRRGYRPLGLGITSACLILVFKFGYAVAPLVYAGLLGLVAASAWNAWPKRTITAGSCPKVRSGGVGVVTTNAP
jgi:mercuric ion transport protein